MKRILLMLPVCLISLATFSQTQLNAEKVNISGSSGNIKLHMSGNDASYTGADMLIRRYGTNAGVGKGAAIQLEDSSATLNSHIIQGSLAGIQFFNGVAETGSWSEHMRIAMDGSVGIGTANISNQQGWQRVLDLHGDINAKLLVTSNSVKTGIFSHNTWGVAAGRIGTESAHPLFLTAGYGNDVVAVLPNGNVGIGTTTPGYKLHVNGNMYVGAKLGFRSYDVTDGGDSWEFGANAGNFNFKNVSQSIIPVTLLSNGNVGIGTTSPLYKLDVNGEGNFNGFLKVKSNNASNPIIGSRNPLYLDAANYSSNSSAVAFVKGNEQIAEIATDISANGGRDLYMIAGGNLLLNPWNNAGNVGIGVTQPQTKLAVNGDITAKKIKVTQTGWPDYVFDSSYLLLSLSQIETFIKENKHLPEVPSAAQVKKEGLDLGDNQAVLLKKIEELTLYIIQQNKQIEHQNKQLNQQNSQLILQTKQMEQIEKRLQELEPKP